MAYMYLTFLVSVLTLAVVQCAGPTCTSACKAPQTCQWTCTNSTGVVAGALITSCVHINDSCGVGSVKDGTCTPGCVAPTAELTCTSACAATKTCQWTCTKSTGVVAGAIITSCVHINDPCGVGASKDGKCTRGCVAPNGSDGKTTTAPKSGTGSIKHGLSPFILTCGIIAKLFLSV